MGAGGLMPEGVECMLAESAKGNKRDDARRER